VLLKIKACYSSSIEETVMISVAEVAVGGRCGVCRCQIHVLESGRYVVIKASIIKVDLVEQVTYAKCPRCKNWVIAPLQYKPGAQVACRQFQ
jgi:hypothetical protein